MKVKTFTPFAALLLLLIGAAACKDGGGKKADPNVDYYTCTMHPSVRSQDPNGKCPICSMDLVPVMKKGAGNELEEQHRHGAPAAARRGTEGMNGRETYGSGLTEFSVPVARQQQIGVTYATAEIRPLRRTIRTVGRAVPDRSRRWSYVARVEGYVQKLNVITPGERVGENEPLFSIYSPELLTAERELTTLLEMRDHGGAGADRLVEAARRRLEQWNITSKQIADLEKTRKPSEFLTLYSPFQGVVEDVPVEQGRKVMPGDPLVTVDDLSSLWIWADFYEDEIRLIAKGQTVRLSTNSYPGQSFDAEVSLLDPFVSESTRTAKVRIDVGNPDSKLKPGMYLNVELEIDGGKGLAIPANAVTPTGMRSLTFVDRGEGKLEPRVVQLGARYGDFYEVLSGLKEGDRVVASANFLIDAESKIQGAVKSFEEPAPDPGETPRRTMKIMPVAAQPETAK